MNKLQSAEITYTFDDFVLVPQYSAIKSRKDPDISVNIDKFNYSIPIISSPMNTVTEEDMIITMAKLGGLEYYIDIWPLKNKWESQNIAIKYQI